MDIIIYCSSVIYNSRCKNISKGETVEKEFHYPFLNHKDFLHIQHHIIMTSKVPRISVEMPQIKNYNKILRSCALSKKIYSNVLNNDLLFERRGQCLYICFKGCSTLSDFITSVDIRNCRIHGEAVGIHNGFCERSKSLRSEVDYNILSNCMQHTITDVIFTGHSAGGSLAKIFSLFSYDNLCKDIKLHCYTFGSPKTGDEQFKEAIEEFLGENVLRIETYNDIVCLIPMQKRFQHIGKGLILENGNTFNSNEHLNKNDITKLSMGDYELNMSYNNNQIKFFSYYHTDYLEFIRDIQDKGLLRKHQINKMINEHSCDNYISNLTKLIQSQLHVTKR